MTFGVIGRDNPFLAEMIALACEAKGHACLVFKDLADATRILHAFRVDVIVMEVQKPAVHDLEWMEALAHSRPDLPSRTLLLTSSELTPNEVARVQQLGAEVVSRPCSFVDIQHVVRERLQKVRSVEAPG